jgi:hypothetical protein
MQHLQKDIYYNRGNINHPVYIKNYISDIEEFIIEVPVDNHLANKYRYDIISYLLEIEIPRKFHFIIMELNKITNPVFDLVGLKKLKIINPAGLSILNDKIDNNL